MEVVQKIDGYDTFTGSQSGFSGGPSPQYLEYLKLAKIASVAELKELTNHPNPVVRCYAFDAVCEKKNLPLILEIAKEHSSDHALVKTMSGCIGYERMAGDIMMDTATYTDEYTTRPLSQTAIAELDRFIIDSESQLQYKDTAIEKMQLTEDNYLKIKKLLISNESKGAVVKLSEYKKQSDIPLLIDFFNSIEKNENDYLAYYAFNRAAMHFPHPELFPLLENEMVEIVNHDYINPGWQALYDAIAGYNNRRAAELLSMPFHSIEDNQLRKHHLGFVFNAVNRFPSHYYLELQWKLWEQENLIASETCEELFVVDAKRAFAISCKLLDIKASVDNVANPKLPNPDDFEYPEEFMLRTILMNDNEPEAIVINAIREKPYIEIYLNYIRENPNTVFIEPLFERLAVKPQSSVSGQIAETLLFYNDKKINKRLLEVRRNNTCLLGNESITNLLKEKGLIQ